MERLHKTLRGLPSLDFLRGFEAAGRRLSFTLAAEELFLTQSALSRQIKALEQLLGRQGKRQAAARRHENAQEVERRQSAPRRMHSLPACKPIEMGA